VTSQTAAAPARFDATLLQARRAWRAAAAVRPAYVLSVLVAVQWIAVLALALTVRHNGWLYYAGGDQLWHYSGSYLLAHGHLPQALVGYGWSVLLLPVAAIAGPNLVTALPALVLFNTLVLLPVALLCLYGIGARIAGRMFGYLAAALWIAVPYLGILAVQPGYHQKYTELTLPQSLGLSSVPDFPSTVGLIVAAYFALRATQEPGWAAPALGGLAAGYALAIKPSNAIFLCAPALLLLAVRRRQLLPFAAGLAPAVLTLALWKYRGLGELAATPSDQVRLASGVGGLVDRALSPSLNNWKHLHEVILGFREHFWLARVIEWLPLAGCTALLLRSLRGFLLVGSWFIAYLLIKGTYVLAGLDDATFFRLLMPAFPAYVLLCAAVVLLIPGIRARPAVGAERVASRRLALAVGVAVVVFGLAPLAVVAATTPLHDGGTKAIQQGISLIPVSTKLQPHVQVTGGEAHVTWQPQTSRGAKLFYRVFRGHGDRDVACGGRLNNAADDCRQFADDVGATQRTELIDHPPKGMWTYRVGVAANWLNDPTLGDVYFVSTPVTVTVG
jgi:hypothetical protein